MHNDDKSEWKGRHHITLTKAEAEDVSFSGCWVLDGEIGW